jgi:hypothetical protein
MIDAELRLARVEHPARYGERVAADITSAGKALTAVSDLDIAKALAHALAERALPAPALEVEAVPAGSSAEAA